MNSRTKVRTVRGGDIGLAAAILAVVLLGWLTAPGGNGAAPHSGQLVGPVQVSARPGSARLSAWPGPARPSARPRPGGDGAGNLNVAPRSLALLHQ
jgi:hypothetical protein